MARIYGKSGAVNELLKRVRDPAINSINDVYVLLKNIEKKKLLKNKNKGLIEK